MDLRVLTHLDAVNVDASLLDVLLGVIPSTTSVGGRDGHLDGGRDGASKKTSNGGGTKENTGDERGAHDKNTREDHLAEGGVGGDLNAASVVGRAVAGLTGEETRDGVELTLDLLDHLVGGDTDGLHGHGSEPVRDESTDKESSKNDRGEDRDVRLGETRALGEGTKEGKTNEAGTANGKALSDSSGGVTSSVKSISDVTDLLRETSHLGNATSVITDRSVDINSEASGESAEHTEGSKRNAEHVEEGEGEVHHECEEEDRDDGTLVSKGKTVDDVGGSTGLTGLGNLASGLVRVAGVELSDETDEASGPETSPDAGAGVEPVTLEVATVDTVNVEVGGEGKVGDGEDSHGSEKGGDTDLDLEDLLDVRLLAHGGEVGGNEGGQEAHEETDGGDHDGEHDSSPAASAEARGGGGDDKGSAGSLSKGAEEIRAHTGNIANVVTDVVSNGGGVTGVVLGDAAHDLAGKIGTNISSLGVDTTTDTAEESNGAATETEAGNTLEESLVSGLVIKVVDLVVSHDEHVENNKAETAESKAHNTTSAEGSVEGSSPGVSGVHSHDGGAGVTENGDLHAEVSAGNRGESTDDEGEGSEGTLLPLPGITNVGGEDEHKGTEHYDKDKADLVLSKEEAVSTLADSVVDLEHAGRGVAIGKQAEGVVRRAGVIELNICHDAELQVGKDDTDNTGTQNKDGGGDVHLTGRHGCELPKRYNSIYSLQLKENKK